MQKTHLCESFTFVLSSKTPARLASGIEAADDVFRVSLREKQGAADQESESVL